METHQMQLLGNNVFICPVCFHMVRYTPFEERKFTVMVQGNTYVSHTGATTDDLKLYPIADTLERLNRLLTGHSIHSPIYLDISSSENWKTAPNHKPIDWIYLN